MDLTVQGGQSPASYMKSAADWPPPDMPAPRKSKVAQFCAATWPKFTPALTLDEVYEDCLQKMGKLDELKAHLWATFQETLYAGSLRKYLKMLPDFEDMEAEEQALSHAETHAHLGAKIHFLLAWPDLRRLAKQVIARAEDLDGNSYETLTAAADALEPDHPLAATLLRRAMITDTLDGSKTKRYRHAARHLSECQLYAVVVEDFGSFPDHDQFLAALKQKHGRKYGFWELVEG